ncbi:MAG TPA: hypothetical protein VEX86_15450 [Longimicrobium sp.]|nr:hypothetical protein [Longimicrobium sp.]
MDDPHRRELLDVLRETRAMLARPGNEFMWSSWEDADAALAEVDGLIERLEAGGLPYRTAISILFAVTGPVQETAISSGWGDEFLVLADRCDAAVAAVYNQRGG